MTEFKEIAERLLDKHLAPLKQPYLVKEFTEALLEVDRKAEIRGYEKGLEDSFKAVTECPPVEAENFLDGRSRFRDAIWKLKPPRPIEEKKQ